MKANPRSTRRNKPRTPGRWFALVLAVAFHLALFGVFIFSIRWQSAPVAPITAELYAPPLPIRVPPPPKAEPPPPKPEPPPPKPVALPPTLPPVATASQAPPPQIDPRTVEIALKKKQDEERRQKMEADQRAAAEKAARERAEAARKAAEKKADDEKKAAEDRQERETEEMLAQAQSESQAREQAEQQRAQAEQERVKAEQERVRAEQERARAAQERERAEQQAAAQNRALTGWIDRIRAKIHGNIALPPDIPGNPEAQFDVTLLPTGEILDAKLVKSSGVPAYDDAVQRAIMKSTPLPRPDDPGVFTRILRLNFRPKE
jgi:colicin import membrane protein